MKTTSIVNSPEYVGRVALVAVTAASNVTGLVQPVHRLARKAHAAPTRGFSPHECAPSA